MRLADRKARVRCSDADAGARHDLEPSAEGDAMHRGDHGHRQLAPAPGDMLRQDAALVVACDPRAGPAARHARHVEAGAEPPPLTRQHDAAHVGAIVQRVDRRADGFEHRRIDRIHLVGPRQADVGNAVGDGRGDAVVHGSLPNPARSP
ncbi:hypothetical protein WR25_04923 [Diploscapter pachys]|uniref:Uncharacterized protein n=1 Tax=Diploscapter pachys TaxID=2018661 RepID=A0A2A2K7K2_9BILA|nr:hypothetical protein WR25_04923 [Diploscapter pachys]